MHTLPSFAEAAPLGSSDAAFVADIQAVLAKHGNLDRFGLCLLHEHFAVSDGEILLETNDKESRELTCTVRDRTELESDAYKATSWSLRDLQNAPYALTKCASDKCK
jgi:hypothetical protein